MGEDIVEKISKKTVKQIFEGFVEINDISKSEEERFKQLIDDAGDDE